MTHQRLWHFILILLTLVPTGFHPLAVASSNIITLDTAVHFTTVNGRDVVVHQGVYIIEATEKALRLIPRAPLFPISLEAERTSHEEELLSPLALSIPGVNAIHYIILLLPNEQSFETVGSYTGVRDRALRKSRTSGFSRNRALAKRKKPTALVTLKKPTITPTSKSQPMTKKPPSSAQETSPQQSVGPKAKQPSALTQGAEALKSRQRQDRLWGKAQF